MQTTETRNLLWLGGIAVVLSLIFNILFFEENIGLNYPLFVLSVLIAGYLLINKFKIKNIDRSTVVLSVLALFFSIMVFVRSSALLTFFNIVGTGLLLLTIIYLHKGKKLEEYLPLDYLKLLISPVLFIPVFFEKVSELIGLQKYSSVTKEVIRGVIITLVVLVVFTSLFASADVIFGRTVDNLLSFKVDPELLGRLIVFVFVASFFLGGFGFMFKKLEIKTDAVGVQNWRSLGVIETKMVLVSLNILFFIFIIFQLTYLFGGESHVLSQGLSYAEYARKGFFELLVVALLCYVIISVTERMIVKKEGRHLLFFKTLSSILVIQVLVILISAFVRLSLYEGAYGFSVLRLYSHSLMIWVGVVLILLSYHIITNGKLSKFALKVFCATVILLLSMNLINPDAFIAKRNMERYELTGKIDAAYLASLSYDALPYTISLLNDPNENIRNQFARGLYWSNTVYNPDLENVRDWVMDKHEWKSYRLGRSRAHSLLVPHKIIMEKNKDFSEELGQE